MTIPRPPSFPASPQQQGQQSEQEQPETESFTTLSPPHLPPRHPDHRYRSSLLDDTLCPLSPPPKYAALQPLDDSDDEHDDYAPPPRYVPRHVEQANQLRNESSRSTMTKASPSHSYTCFVTVKNVPPTIPISAGYGQAEWTGGEEKEYISSPSPSPSPSPPPSLSLAPTIPLHLTSPPLSPNSSPSAYLPCTVSPPRSDLASLLPSPLFSSDMRTDVSSPQRKQVRPAVDQTQQQQQPQGQQRPLRRRKTPRFETLRSLRLKDSEAWLRRVYDERLQVYLGKF